jgi:hypothetical protein
MADNKKRNTIIGLLALTLLPAYYLVAHRMSGRAPELRDALNDTPMVDAGRNSPANDHSRHTSSHEGAPAISEGSDMRDAVRNDAVGAGPSDDGQGPNQPPSFDNPPNMNVSDGPGNNYTPENPNRETRELQESQEVSPSAP